MDREEQVSPETARRAESWLTDHGDYLYRYARSRLVDASAAEDLLQETFLAGMQRLSSFRGDSSERTWLVGILRFKLLEHHRKRLRETPAPSDQTDAEDWFDTEGHWNRSSLSAAMEWDPDPSALLDKKEFWEALRRCLDQLPPRTSAVFVQRELEFRQPKEIMEQLDISASNLWVLLHRARNHLRRCIQAFWKS